jgi:hypothetical protein
MFLTPLDLNIVEVRQAVLQNAQKNADFPWEKRLDLATLSHMCEPFCANRSGARPQKRRYTEKYRQL